MLHILDLPYEIIYLIFTFAWTQTDHKQNEFPIIASHVCRLWRQHALNTPSFWTSLKFKKSIPEIEKYQTWLERSKDSPFDLEIGWEPFLGASTKHAKAIMRLIFPHVQRLRSLQVSQVPFKIRQVVFDRLNSAYMPSLETLRVKRGLAIDEKPSIADRKFKPFRHGDVANLKHVDLEWVPYNYVIHRFNNLETLRIVTRASSSSRGNAKSVQDILSMLPDLRILRLCIERVHFSEPQSVIPLLPPLTHNSLEEVDLEASQDDVSTILCNLILPSVRQLRGQPGAELSISIRCLPTMAQAHPYPNLISLQLHGQDHHPTLDWRYLEFLERALVGVPLLKSLILGRADLEDNKHLLCLTRTCPRLKRLVISYCSGFGLKELRAMIRSRRDPEGMNSNSLESVHVFDVTPRLQSLHEEAKEHGLGGDADFNITISMKDLYRIVVIGSE